MGETLAETRLEIEGQRAQLQQTAERLKARLKRSLDLKAKVRENPLLVAGLVGGAIFLAFGGPVRVARLVRRRTMRTRPEKAYDALPKTMQDFVDSVVGRAGPRVEEARQALAVELARWRHDPRHNKKVSREIAKQMVEGPPGPGRAAWKAFEAGAAILSAALARRAVERFLSGEPPSGKPRKDWQRTFSGAAEPDGAPGSANPITAAAPGYTGRAEGDRS